MECTALPDRAFWMPKEQRLVQATDAERPTVSFCSVLNGSLDVTTRNHWRDK